MPPTWAVNFLFHSWFNHCRAGRSIGDSRVGWTGAAAVDEAAVALMAAMIMPSAEVAAVMLAARLVAADSIRYEVLRKEKLGYSED